MSILQRTLGHVTLPEGTDASEFPSDSDDAADDSPAAVGAVAFQEPATSATGRSLRAGATRESSGRGIPPPPLQPMAMKATRFSTHGSWLFGPCAPTADEVAQRCLAVLYQVSLVVAGDVGVSGGSGGRLSGQSGQRSKKVYTPPARIFRRLAQPDVVSAVAQVSLAFARTVQYQRRPPTTTFRLHLPHTLTFRSPATLKCFLFRCWI